MPVPSLYSLLMRIGVIHNFYQWRGGEDSVFEAECSLLQRYGCQVEILTVHNKEIVSLAHKIRTFFGCIWSQKHYREVQAFLREKKIQVLHVHNFFPLFSPAVFWAAWHENVPVVFTVHNYRLGCVNAQFFRDHNVCTRCEGKLFKLPGVLLACYKNSRAGSLSLALSLCLHRILGTWSKKVSCYIALTEFGKEKILQEGIPSERVVVKPNFVFPQPPLSETYSDHFLFMGRHFEEKGIDHLIAAWKSVPHPAKLFILGEGPLTEGLKALSATDSRVQFLGHVSAEKREELRRTAKAVIFPSVWFEGFPMVITETLAAGVPVLSSGLGAMNSIIQDGVNGLFFPPANPMAIAQTVNRVCENPSLLEKLRAGARETAKTSYQASQNFELLKNLYSSLILKRKENK